MLRIKGSHHYLKHKDGRAAVIPIHSNENIGIGLFLKILKDLELTKDDFEKIKKLAYLIISIVAQTFLSVNYGKSQNKQRWSINDD